MPTPFRVGLALIVCALVACGPPEVDPDGGAGGGAGGSAGGGSGSGTGGGTGGSGGSGGGGGGGGGSGGAGGGGGGLVVLPTLSIAGAGVVEGDTGSTQLTLVVTLSSASVDPVTVSWSTVNGTASAGSDFVGMNNAALTFPSGSTLQSIQVSVTGDTDFEANESFTVELSSPQGATLAQASATASISNDDTEPVLSIADGVANETDAGVLMPFTVTLSRAVSNTISVNFATRDGGTAVGGVDFDHLNGTLTFAGGETSKTVQVNVLGDGLDEDEETLEVELSMPVGALIADGLALGRITDDDLPPTATVSSLGAVLESTGTAAFRIQLSSPSAKTVVVEYVSASGTAQPATDFVSTVANVTFLPGETDKMVTIGVIADTLAEASETFTVSLSAGGSMNVVLNPAAAVQTVLDDDRPTLAASNITLIEGDTGLQSAVFTLTLSAPATVVTTVGFATVAGTATAGADFTPTNASVTFQVGESSKTVNVPVAGDMLDEINESFGLTLTGALVNLPPTGPACFINDNDPSPTLSVQSVLIQAEGTGAGNTTFAFSVSLSALSGRPVSFTAMTANGTALAGTDYFNVFSQFVIPAGVSSINVNVSVLRDAVAEANETFQLNLSGLSNAVPGIVSSTATIQNDD